MLLLAHLSQRLIQVGELIVYPWSGVRGSVHFPQCSNISKTAVPIKAKFYVEPSLDGVWKFVRGIYSVNGISRSFFSSHKCFLKTYKTAFKCNASNLD